MICMECADRHPRTNIQQCASARSDPPTYKRTIISKVHIEGVEAGEDIIEEPRPEELLEHALRHGWPRAIQLRYRMPRMQSEK